MIYAWLQKLNSMTQQPVFEKKNLDIYLTTFADFYKEALDRIQWNVMYLKSDFCLTVSPRAPRVHQADKHHQDGLEVLPELINKNRDTPGC